MYSRVEWLPSLVSSEIGCKGIGKASLPYSAVDLLYSNIPLANNVLKLLEQFILIYIGMCIMQ